MDQCNAFKVVIMSATMKIGTFSKFFDDAPVVKVKGFHYPVQVKYDPGRTHEHVVSVIAKILDKKQKGKRCLKRQSSTLILATLLTSKFHLRFALDP